MSITERKEREQRHRKRISLHFGTNGPTSGGFTTNVSAWGLCVTTPSIHPPRTLLQMEARLTETRTARLTARVSWALRGTPALGIPNTMGLRLETADEVWFTFVSGLDEASRKPVAEAATAPVVATPEPVRHVTPMRRSGSPRLVERHAVAWPVRFGAGAKPDLTGTTLDVGAMGLAIATPTLPAAGSNLFLEVTLPGGELVRCEGVVVRQRRLSVREHAPNSMAVRLVRADEGWYRAVMALEPRGK